MLLHLILGDLIHLIGYITPTKRPPSYYGTTQDNYNPYNDNHRPQRPSASEHTPSYDTNVIGSGSVYSGGTEPLHHQIFDENGHEIISSGVYSNRPLYANRPDPVFHQKPSFSRPTKRPSSSSSYEPSTAFSGIDEGFQRSKLVLFF